MKKLTDYHADAYIRKEAIPSLDLYMDQVTQLFDQTFKNTKRNAEEKVLTKTMINNYAKGKLLFPVEQKKYQMKQIMLIQMIYQLKGALSIQDIQASLEPVKAVSEETRDLEKIYETYTKLLKEDDEQFIEQLERLEQAVKKETTGQETSVLKDFYTISRLVHFSTMYRKVAENYIDHVFKESEPKK